jgi:adenylyltransferase/sulfurtransferase
MLTDDELLRYSRQILLPEIDVAGQEALAAATVVIVGAGGLGNPAALYLVGAGIKKLIVADGDSLETSNLHRQIAFREAQQGENKAQALAAQLSALNPAVDIQTCAQFADEAWLNSIVKDATVVLDCSDNFATRTLVNRVCREQGVPLVSGAAIRFEGQLVTFDFRQPDAPCYGCLYGDGSGPDTFCSESGILGPVVGIIGTMQAMQAIKLICGLAIEQKLYLFDGKTMNWQSIGFRKDPACPECSVLR